MEDLNSSSPCPISSPSPGLEKVVRSLVCRGEWVCYQRPQTLFPSSMKWNDVSSLEWWLSRSWCLKSDREVGVLLKRKLISSSSDFVHLELTWHCKSTILQKKCLNLKKIIKLSWASLVNQLVKNPPAMQKTRIRSLGWEGPLEKGKATHSSIMA